MMASVKGCAPAAPRTPEMETAFLCAAAELRQQQSASRCKLGAADRAKGAMRAQPPGEGRAVMAATAQSSGGRGEVRAPG